MSDDRFADAADVISVAAPILRRLRGVFEGMLLLQFPEMDRREIGSRVHDLLIDAADVGLDPLARVLVSDAVFLRSFRSLRLYMERYGEDHESAILRRMSDGN